MFVTLTKYMHYMQMKSQKMPKNDMIIRNTPVKVSVVEKHATLRFPPEALLLCTRGAPDVALTLTLSPPVLVAFAVLVDGEVSVLLINVPVSVSAKLAPGASGPFTLR